MKHTFKLFPILFSVLLVAFTSCNNSGSKESKEVKTEPIQVVDEAKVPLLPNDVFEDTINGVHVVMAYNVDNKYFKGSLENVTEEQILGVKAIVYLSNGLVFNTSPTDLKVDAYETSVIMDADVKQWDKWGIEVEFTSKELTE